jgi:hypothetical protein
MFGCQLEKLNIKLIAQMETNSRDESVKPN